MDTDAAQKWFHNGPPLPLSREFMHQIPAVLDRPEGCLITSRMADAGVQSFVVRTPPLMHLLWYGCGRSCCMKNEEEIRRYWTSEELLSFYIVVASSSVLVTRCDKMVFDKRMLKAALTALPVMQIEAVCKMNVQTSSDWAALRNELTAAGGPNPLKLLEFAHSSGMCSRDAARMTLSLIGALEQMLWVQLGANAEPDTLKMELINSKSFFITLDHVVLASEWNSAAPAIKAWGKIACKSTKITFCGGAHATAFKQWPNVKVPVYKQLLSDGNKVFNPKTDYIHPVVAVNNLVAIYYCSLLAESTPSVKKSVEGGLPEDDDSKAVTANH